MSPAGPPARLPDPAGSAISSIDPVATLAVLADVEVGSTHSTHSTHPAFRSSGRQLALPATLLRVAPQQCNSLRAADCVLASHPPPPPL